MNLNEYSNSELEEMGFPPCECLTTYREFYKNDVFDVCSECGAAVYVERRVAAWM